MDLDDEVPARRCLDKGGFIADLPRRILKKRGPLQIYPCNLWPKGFGFKPVNCCLTHLVEDIACSKRGAPETFPTRLNKLLMLPIYSHIELSQVTCAQTVERDTAVTSQGIL